MGNTAGNKTYTSPVRKLVRFFEKSRDQWKSKHHQLKTLVKRQQNRMRFLEQSKHHWKSRVKTLEAEVARLKAREQALAKEVEVLKKSERPNR